MEQQTDGRTKSIKIVDGCANTGYVVGSVVGSLLKGGFKALISGTEIIVLGGASFLSAAAGGASESIKRKKEDPAPPLKFRKPTNQTQEKK